MNKDEKAFEWLERNELSYTIWNNKYRHGDESFDNWLDRVSGGNTKIAELIEAKKFLFGGRTLSNRGLNKGSYNNCYSIGFVPDSLEGIMDVNTKLALTYKAEGGQGADLSLIRPKGAPIKDTYISDGIIPFMRVFNTTTSSISQGGSRKGALMLSLDVWHAEAENFIKIKSDDTEINKANLSMVFDNEFMHYVELYIEGTINETVHFEKTKMYEGKPFTYEVYPIKLYKSFCKYAREHAEPGAIFAEYFRNYNIMQLIDSYQIETCNPCGEQPLPKHGCCALCSINLSEYVVDAYTENSGFNHQQLCEDINTIVRAMDDLIDENLPNHALVEQRDQAANFRNIGIGYMGVADMFVKLGITYGSDEAILFMRSLGSVIFRNAVISSSQLAAEKGSFPMYEDKVWESEIIKNHFTENEIKQIMPNGLRNCALLSIAPTGSIGTMLNISTGCEPFFALSYKRKTESLHKDKEQYYDVYIGEAENYLQNYGTVLPDCFVCSKDISFVDRIRMQAAMQYSIDTAISSTINLPNDTTVEDIEKLYYLAWHYKLKGVTIYVDGTRAPILSTEEVYDKTDEAYVKRPKQLEADYYPIKVKGEQFLVLVGLYKGKPYEVFTFRPTSEMTHPQHKGVITKVKKGHYSYDSGYLTISNIHLANENVEENAASLYSSMLLRHGIDIPFIIKTAKKVNFNITSFSSAMCRILAKYISDETLEEKCPECGNNLRREGGCIGCPSCGYSKCS